MRGCVRAPFFAGLVGLVLHGGGQGIPQHLPALVEQEGLAGVEDASEGSLPGLLLQLDGEIQGHLGDMALQGRMGQQRRFGHLPCSWLAWRLQVFYPPAP